MNEGLQDPEAANLPSLASPYPILHTHLTLSAQYTDYLRFLEDKSSPSVPPWHTFLSLFLLNLQDLSLNGIASSKPSLTHPTLSQIPYYNVCNGLCFCVFSP